MYVLTYLLGLVLSFRRSQFFFFAYLLLLWLLASFRYGVGPDYFAYKDLYFSLQGSVLDEIKVETRQEFLFRVFGAFLKSFEVPYELYLSVVALISLVYISATVKKYSSNPLLSVFLYHSIFYFVWIFSGIRQGLAISIGTYYLLECMHYGRHIRFLLIVILLSMIHASAIILLPLYFIARINFRSDTLWLIFVASLFFSALPFVDYLDYFRFMPYYDRLLFYSPNYNSDIFKILDYKSIARFLFMLIGFAALRKYKENPFQRRIIVLYILSFVFYNILKFSEVMAANSTVYGFVLLVIIIPNLIHESKEKKIIYSILIYMMSFLFFLKNLGIIEGIAGVLHSEFVLPYTHIFSPNEYTILGPE